MISQEKAFGVFTAFVLLCYGSGGNGATLGKKELDYDWVDDLEELRQDDDFNNVNVDSMLYQDGQQESAMDRIYQTAKKAPASENKVNSLFEVDINSGKQENQVDNSDFGRQPGSPSKLKYPARSPELLWKDAEMIFEKAADLDEKTNQTIDQVMLEIMLKTCIRFREKRNGETAFVSITKDFKCSSDVGMQGKKQKLTISERCSDYGAITHLIIHALGLWHEQSRPDRDKYIEVLWENIYPGEEFRFNKQSLSNAADFGLTYDYESIMHYGSQIFAINESLPTMRSIYPKNPINPGQGMSVLDLQKLNTLYGCTNDRIQGTSQWSSFGPCDGNCQKRRRRLCPVCSTAVNGIETETKRCREEECNAPIPGHWSRWSYYTCETKCGFGNTRRRYRKCDDPPPINNGSHCSGVSTETKQERCYRGTCKQSYYDCQFENFQRCHWTNVVNNEYKHTWIPRSGGTPTASTGPYSDSTVGTPQGIYMYFETSSPTKKDDKVVLKSPVIQSTDYLCLTFKYHMYGATMGTINVRIGVGNNTSIVWNATGDQGKAWQQMQIDISRTTPYHILIEGISGGQVASDMAIDDLQLRLGVCSSNPSTTLMPPTEKPSMTIETTAAQATTDTEPTTTATDKAPVTTSKVHTTATRPSTTAIKPTMTIARPPVTTTTSPPNTINLPTATTTQPSPTPTSPTSTTSATSTISTPQNTTKSAPTTTFSPPTTSTSPPTTTTNPLTTNSPTTTNRPPTTLFGSPTTTAKSPITITRQPTNATVLPPPTNQSSVTTLELCNFDQDHCGWTPRNFERRRGTPSTVPHLDHTSGKGFFMISKTWGELEKEFNATSRRFCLKVWFYKAGPGWLSVIVETNWGWKKIGFVGRRFDNRWRLFCKEFSTSAKTFKIIFRSWFRSRFALDDININTGVCSRNHPIMITPKHNFRCDFSTDACGFHRTPGYLVSFYRSRAGYLLFHSYHRKPRARVAIVVSPSFNTSSETCLRFSFNFMRRRSRRLTRISLRLFVRNPGLRHSSRVLWTCDSTKRRSYAWRNAQVTVRNTGIFELGFTGIIYASGVWRSRFAIGIDNISLTRGRCPVIQHRPCLGKSRKCRHLRLRRPYRRLRFSCRRRWFARVCPRSCRRCPK